MKKNQRNRNRKSEEAGASFSEKLVNGLEFPKDLMLGAAIVTVTGRREAVIANYRGILEYEDSRIRIQTKNCRILISGSHLAIDYYTNEEMKITGFIGAIEYEN
ncbi:MAG: YabP/YqfC family sporulation protein [Roseburia sp.]